MGRLNLIERRLERFLREPPSVRNAAGVIAIATVVVVVADSVPAGGRGGQDGGGLPVTPADYAEVTSAEVDELPVVQGVHRFWSAH
jgi:hypothetical protein